jgi:hypothetical protein
MRKSALILVLVLSGAVGTAPAKAKKDAPVSKLFCQARFVYVQTVDGDVLDPRVVPEDRDAANQLIEQLQDWKRYTLVTRRREADLVWVVRTGRLASVGLSGGPASTSDPGVTVGGGSRGANAPGDGGAGPGAGGTPNPGSNGQDPGNSGGIGGQSNRVGNVAEIGEPDDMLAIFTGPAEGPPLQSWLWRHTLQGGLQDPNMPLFQQIRRAVDAGCVDPGPKH